jgi:phenylpropionate dioxygenase-like ring-hydroxylating dioxygenase large terminal subunit
MTSISERPFTVTGTGDLTSLVRPDQGTISRRVFSSEEIYRQELERVFTKTWLFIGHESQLRQPGDYITNFMAEDPVIATRAADGRIRVLLNSCRHRGMAVCTSDTGTSKFFRCPYHGWTYSNNGELVGVPRADVIYHGELDKSRLGLTEVPRVDSYKGMIFANWDPGAIPLADYLGRDHLWYLDLAFEAPLGGLEVLGPTMKFRIKANWKLAAENFAGDDYHVLYTHGSAFQIGFLPDYDLLGDYIAHFPHGHGMGDIAKPGRAYQNDLGMAQFLGTEATEYLTAVHERLENRVTPRQAEMHGLGEGNIFPNLSWIKFGVFHVFGLFQWHPKGPGEMEVWQTAFFDAAAPQSVKDFARTQMSQENAAAGIFGQDDGENFEQITESARGFVSQTRDFDYSMGLAHEGEVHEDGYPGHLGPHYSEQNHRNFYRYWLQLMTAPGRPQ